MALLTKEEILSKFKPVGYRILVEVPIVTEKTEGGILLSTKYRDKEEMGGQIGEVIAMGDECFSGHEKFGKSPWYKVGDKIFFTRYAGTRMFLKGVDNHLRSLADEDVHMVVSEDVKSD
jgi:co-chaperonin GroES (HSP10)